MDQNERQSRANTGRKAENKTPFLASLGIGCCSLQRCKNELLVVECKSYLDSRGVPYSAFDGSSEKDAKRYKLFTDSVLREVVLYRLAGQMTNAGFCPQHPKMQLCLAAGNIYGDSDRLRNHFEANNWLLWDAKWLRGELTTLAMSGYDNSIAAIVSKLLLRLPPAVQIQSSEQ